MKIVEVGILSTILAASLFSEAIAQTNCENSVAALTPCFNYVSGSSSAPSSQCCSQLQNVVQTKPMCLCYVQNQGGSLNKTRVLEPPGECSVPTPPTSGSNSPPGSTSSQTPPSPTSGDSTRVSCSIMLSVILAASLIRIFTI